ncbi:MAG: hypothetical protein WCV88_05750 [Patescibacteria group bacterium]
MNSAEKKKIIRTLKIVDTPTIETPNRVRYTIVSNIPSCSSSDYCEKLMNQLKDDIFPLFRTKGFAPFTIARNCFCYIDHIARLRFGKDGSMGNINKLMDDFGSYPFIKEQYKLYKFDLQQTYRHHLVHNVDPWPMVRQIKLHQRIETHVIGFHIKSKLPNSVKQKRFSILKRKFSEEKFRAGLCHLRYDKNYNPIINTYCLFFDTIDYISRYRAILSTDDNEERDFAKHFIDLVIENLDKADPKKVGPLDYSTNKLCT